MNWKNLLNDIEEEQAILLIGPDFMHVGGQSLHSQMQIMLQEQFAADIQYHYKRDGLFLFKDGDRKAQAARQIRRIYRQLSPDELMLQRVVSTPFHLILSLTPDTFLRDAFEQSGITPYFHYFDRKCIDYELIEQPDRTKPLVYNLCGVIHDDESLILDYDDMFDFLKSMLTNGLPPKIQRLLNKAGSFVFLGFDFEKWHTQMLLRILSGKKGIQKYAFENEKPENDTCDFLINQFKVQFQEGEKNNETFFDSLYRHCEEANLLRNIINTFNKSQVKVMHLVYRGKLGFALETLEQFGFASEDEWIMLRAQLSQLEDNKDQGIIRMDESQLQWNKIAYGIVQIAKKIC